MEVGNGSKRQQPDQRAENSRRPPKSRKQDKFPHPEVGFSGYKMYTSSIKIDITTTSKIYK